MTTIYIDNKVNNFDIIIAMKLSYLGSVMAVFLTLGLCGAH